MSERPVKKQRIAVQSDYFIRRAFDTMRKYTSLVDETDDFIDKCNKIFYNINV